MPKIPKNIRFTRAQVDAIKRMQTEEHDFSYWVREAVNDLLSKSPRIEESPAKSQQTLRIPVRYSGHLKQSKGRKARARKSPPPKGKQDIQA